VPPQAGQHQNNADDAETGKQGENVGHPPNRSSSWAKISLKAVYFGSTASCSCVRGLGGVGGAPHYFAWSDRRINNPVRRKTRWQLLGALMP
jgi:hypothetical protein